MKNILIICMILSFINSNSFAFTGEELQQKGVDGIEKFIDYFRQTGQLNNNIAEESLIDLNKSIELFKKDKKFKKVALSQVKIGDILRMSNKFDLAYAYYKKALEQSLKIGDKENQVRALLGKTRVEILYFNKYGDASKNLNQAITLLKSLDIKKLHVEILDFTAQVEVEQGDYISAFLTLDKAFYLAKNIKDNEFPLFYLYNTRADINFNLARTCDYDNFFNECMEKLKLAERDYNKSLKIAKKLKWNFVIDIIKNTNLSIIKENINLVNMREKSKKKWDKLSSTFNPKNENNVLVHERFILTPIKDYFSSSMSISLKATILAGKLFSVETVNQHYLEAFEQETKGEIDKALKMYMETVDLLEEQRANLDTLKTDDFLNDKMDIYYTPLLHLLNLKRKEEAFNLFERSKSKTLLDLINSSKFKNNKELISLENLMRLSAKISLLKKKKEIKKLNILEKKYNKLILLTKKKSNKISIEIPLLKQVQKNLKEEDYEIVQYLVQKTQLIVWHITKDKIDVKSVFLPQNELTKKVNSIYETLKVQNASKAFDEKSAKELFLFLIQPILKDIKSKHLVIVPHYELNQLPFQVLINPETNQSLGEIFQISYAPSTSVLMGLNHIKNLQNKKIIAIGNSKMTYGNKELKIIEKYYPHKVSIFNSLTKKKLFKEIKGHSVIHISTHGKYLPNSPMLSYLELKDENLTASEMFAMPLEENSFVILSACETGKVQFTHSNETLGMVRALLYAGADTLLLSSWRVDEKVTVLWMENFYKFAKTNSLSESVRLALIEVKKRYSHPHYWAGFSMIGK